VDGSDVHAAASLFVILRPRELRPRARTARPDGRSAIPRIVASRHSSKRARRRPNAKRAARAFRIRRLPPPPPPPPPPPVGERGWARARARANPSLVRIESRSERDSASCATPRSLIADDPASRTSPPRHVAANLTAPFTRSSR